jgi:hypothetical protein
MEGPMGPRGLPGMWLYRNVICYMNFSSVIM